MTGQGIGQILVYAVVLIALGYPLGLYMARVYAPAIPRALAVGLERGFYRLVRTERQREQDWKSYAKTVLVFTILFFGLLYAIQRLQGHLFLNPDHLKGVPVAHRAEHDRQLRHEHELAVLRRRVHDVVPDADGRAGRAAVRLGRRRDGRARRGHPRSQPRRSRASSGTSGSTSTARSSTSCCRSRSSSRLILLSQGVPQTFAGHATATTLEGAPQTIARGPVALMIAIKQLGTNGGGFYNSNSAVPFENPNGLTNFLEVIAILLIPAAQVFMFGKMVLRAAPRLDGVRGDVRGLRDRGRRRPARRAARLAGAARLRREHHAGRTARAAATWPTRRSASASPTRPSGRRSRPTPRTARSTAATTRYTAYGGAVPLVNIFFGEVIFGGVGSGLYGMFFYIVIAVFIAGLMVGRTPEYLGKKIEAREIKYAARRRALRARRWC